MSDVKLVAAALLVVAIALGGVAWTIHDHTERHGRYQQELGWRFDTLTGRIEQCTGDESGGDCQTWERGR